jgi:hypothetical protein
MNNFLKASVAAIMIMISVVTITSCNKDFDNPPMYEEPNIVPNTTIAALKLLHVSGHVEPLTTDMIIAGVVNADDKSGNYYKQISIQDSTGGITIRLDGNGLYTSYPVGRKVYIKLKGLYLGDYNSLIQIGGSIDNTGQFLNVFPIPSAMFDQYIIKGSLGYVVTPKIVTVDAVTDAYQSMLVQINNAEFKAADTAKTYADAAAQATVNLDVIPCGSTDKITVRTSGFANFAGVGVPNGNGPLIGIYSVFGSAKQMTLRDTSDIHLDGARCTGGGTTPPVGTVLLGEDFQNHNNNTDIATAGWTNFTEAGTKKWYSKLIGTNTFANVSAFGSNSASVKSWLITKGINLGSYTTKTLSFTSSQGHTGTGNSLAASLKVLVSTNFTGTGSPTAATWTDITSLATLSPGADAFPPFISSGNISLNSYTGTIYIAFVYEGADPAGAGDKTSTWEVDDILVTGN